MATPELSSDLSRSQLLAVYCDYADYDLQSSEAAGLARARIFIKAGRMLLSRPVARSASGGSGGEEVELEPQIIERQVQQAVTWCLARQQSCDVLPRQLVPGDDFR